MGSRKTAGRLAQIESALGSAEAAIRRARNAHGETEFTPGGAEDEALTALIAVVDDLRHAVTVLAAEVRDQECR